MKHPKSFFGSFVFPLCLHPLYLATIVCFLSQCISFYFLVFYIYGAIEHTFFYLAFFTQCNYFEIHRWCSVYQQYIPFYCWGVFLLYGFTTTVYPFTCWGTCVCFSFWGYDKSSCYKHVCTSLGLGVCFHSLWVNYLEVKWLYHLVGVCLTF